jgi:uncharacterized protein (DUF433 family)
MTSISNGQSAIVRTERGLAIAGTRITLYQLMDYIDAGYPGSFIRHQFNLTDEQFKVAMSYLETNHAQVEAEYQTVLNDAQEVRHYWEERNKKRLDRIATMPPPPGREAAWEKLLVEKARLKSQE